MVRIEDNVHRTALPIGGGIAYRATSGATVDLRGTFRTVDDHQRTRIELDSDTPAPNLVFGTKVGLAVVSSNQKAFDATSVDQLVVGQTWT